MKQFQISARLNAIRNKHRANNEIVFVSADFLPDEFRQLASKLLTLHIAEQNGHVVQEPLPLPVEPVELPAPQVITIKGQPIGKPRMTNADRFLVGDKTRPCVARYWAWCDVARKAAEGKMPRFLEAVTIRFYFAMPPSWSVEKRLQHDGKPHYDTPDIDNCIKSVLDSLLENDEIIAECHATKRWTNGEPRTEVVFS